MKMCQLVANQRICYHLWLSCLCFEQKSCLWLKLLNRDKQEKHMAHPYHAQCSTYKLDLGCQLDPAGLQHSLRAYVICTDRQKCPRSCSARKNHSVPTAQAPSTSDIPSQCLQLAKSQRSLASRCSCLKISFNSFTLPG